MGPQIRHKTESSARGKRNTEPLPLAKRGNKAPHPHFSTEMKRSTPTDLRLKNLGRELAKIWPGCNVALR